MKELLEYIVKGIVTKPEAVEITENETPEGELELRFKVDPEDMGTVIGKEGRTIRSIRNLVRIKAIHEDKRVRVELEEVPGHERPPTEETTEIKEKEAPAASEE